MQCDVALLSADAHELASRHRVELAVVAERDVRRDVRRVAVKGNVRSLRARRVGAQEALDVVLVVPPDGPPELVAAEHPRGAAMSRD